MRTLKLQIGRALTMGGSFALLLLITSCSRTENKRQVAQQRKFATPDEAGDALFQAVKSGDHNALLAIFGPGGQEVLFTGDSVKDRTHAQDFADAYSQMHRWTAIKAGGEVLNIGSDNHVFSIPLGQDSSGKWYFDTAAGKDEILARRIGKGELIAIEVSGAVAGAEMEYFKHSHDGDGGKQYARQFVSDPGKHNGLYWADSEGQPPSPLGDLGELAQGLGYKNAEGKPQPFNGYYYRILTKQGGQTPDSAKDYIVSGKMTGGFAILAYPAEYRNSGIMTFLVGTDGIIYQKDLGEKTLELGQTMMEYDPGDGWTPVVAPSSKTG
ncbi:MAG TPA: DUF2950 domain-containing protein [Bryobacteraceae bacterium]